MIHWYFERIYRSLCKIKVKYYSTSIHSNLWNISACAAPQVLTLQCKR